MCLNSGVVRVVMWDMLYKLTSDINLGQTSIYAVMCSVCYFSLICDICIILAMREIIWRNTLNRHSRFMQNLHVCRTSNVKKVNVHDYWLWCVCRTFPPKHLVIIYVGYNLVINCFLFIIAINVKWH